MLSPDSRANFARRQAEAPLIALCRFPKPALSSIAMREYFLAGTMKPYMRAKKASTVECFVRPPGALVPLAAQAPFVAPAPFKVLHQRFGFPQVRCVKAFCELLIDCLHQL
jgi:hypothetical protein